MPVGFARRVAAAAGVNLMLIGTDGNTLFYGRTRRCASPAQRHALQIRYPTCSVQGCSTPGTACEVHHLDGGWQAGTPTDLDRMALACGFHNRYAHDHPDQCRETRDHTGRTIIQIRAPWDPPDATPIRHGPPHRTGPPPAHAPPQAA